MEVSSFLLSIGVFEPTGQFSIFAAYNGSEVIIGRNYDMLSSLKKITESSLVCFNDNNKYLGHSDCFIGKVDGINEHGLFVGITAEPHGGIIVFQFKDPEIEVKAVLYELWIGPKKDKVELVIEAESKSKYSQLNEEDSTVIFEIITVKKLSDLE